MARRRTGDGPTLPPDPYERMIEGLGNWHRRLAQIMNRVPSIAWALIVASMAAATNAVAADRAPWSAYAHQPDAWYRGAEGIRVAANILSHQSRLGDWPKNVDNSGEPYHGDRAKIKGTFDNGATVGELRFLARASRRATTPESRRVAQGARPHPGRSVSGGRLATVVASGQGISPAHHLQ